MLSQFAGPTPGRGEGVGLYANVFQISLPKILVIMKMHLRGACDLTRHKPFWPLSLVARRICLIVYALGMSVCFPAEFETLWTIGQADDSSNEFALAPQNYKAFIHQDFGWQDRFYLVGRSQADRDWPYVLPGPADAWAGSGGLAGTRTQVLNILFDLMDFPEDGAWRLVVDLVDVQSSTPPIFKATINGRSWKFHLSPGASSESLNGRSEKGKEQIIEIKLDSGIIRTGGNHIELTIIQGSWLIFDQIRLDGAKGANLAPKASVFVREVKPADYEVEWDGKRSQPLLVDLQQVEGSPEITIRLDDKIIQKTDVEPGRTILEVPMPAARQPKESRYEMSLGENVLSAGKVKRAGHRLNTPADYVDPLMGTAHSRWMIAPGPWMPFGMVKLSPDNQQAGWQSGYDPHIESIGGFSHIHEWTMAGLLLMPTSGPLMTRVGDPYKPDEGYRSRIDKATEEARIGYYRVFLSDYEIEAELTATTRAGFQRYTFPSNQVARVLIDLQIPAEYRFRLDECEIRKVSDHRVEGRAVQVTPNVWSRDAHQEYTLHFVIEFDRPIKSFGVWSGDQVQRETSELKTLKTTDAGAYAEFDIRENNVVQVRTGISLVSLKNAHLNLRKEITEPFAWNFEAVRDNQRQAWNNLLDRVQVETMDRREKVRFYSNLYRSFCARNIWSDVDGSWRDPTETVRRFEDPEAVALGCDAFWNTFWNLNQVWNLTAPEWSSRWVKSQLAMYDACGWLAKGPAGMEYIPVMVAEHEIPLIVGAYQMGIRDFDTEKAFQAVHKMQTTPAQSVAGGFAGNRDIVHYMKYHYVPADKGRASNTLEYSYDDWTVSQFAKALGKTQKYEEYLERSTWWRNMFDEDTGFARLKNSDGKWHTPFDPYRSGANKQYVEGNAWQLTFFVPQDMPGLIEALGRDRFLSRLEDGFTRSAETRFNAPNEKYWDYPVVHGNQQSMHFAFLFNWANAPWLTQKWSREVLNRYYGYGTGDAYLGDEDQGQMSAWFVMAALGLFQTDGGCRVDPIYEIGSPIFPKVTINLGGRYGRGDQIVITARNVSRKNKYVQRAFLNGKKLDRWWFPCSALLQGGELMLDMGSAPNKAWGVVEESMPAD